MPLAHQAAQPQLVAGGHAVYRKTDLGRIVIKNEISLTYRRGPSRGGAACNLNTFEAVKLVRCLWTDLDEGIVER